MKHLRKENWEETKQHHVDWWNGKGCVLAAWDPINAGDFRYGQAEDPGPPAPDGQWWMDFDWRIKDLRYKAASMDCPFDTLPVFGPHLGPGTMALYLGSEPSFQPDTVWYEPCIPDPDSYGAIAFDPENRWWKLQLELLERMKEEADGAYYIGSPDVIENWDTLASMRDAQTLLMDMIERPDWVKEKISEINRAWFQAYDILYDRIREQDGESMFGHFGIWAPGKVSKVQCDGCAMFSPDMFREFVQPALREQCDNLDYSLYHLDGSQCLDKLDALLEIESLTAIEWTPDPKVPCGGDPCWVDMYKRILDAGKRVQIYGSRPEQIEPMIDALGGPEGLFFLYYSIHPETREKLEKVWERIRA